MIYSVDVTIRAPVHPTEVTERVVDAVQYLFPNATIDDRPRRSDADEDEAEDENAPSGGEIVAETHSLDHLSELFHEQAILDTARATFLDDLESEGSGEHAQNDTFEFRLKKQAAFEGTINFSVGSPDELGDIHVTVSVRDPDPETYIHHIAPPTEDGTPIEDEG